MRRRLHAGHAVDGRTEVGLEAQMQFLVPTCQGLQIVGHIGERNGARECAGGAREFRGALA